MAAQLARRREHMSAGARYLGWKAGFGSKAAMERLGTSAPIFGFLLDRNLLEPGSTVSIAGWTRPVFEAEIAAHIGEDGSIAGLGAAVELVDFDPAITDLEEVLAGDIFHRHVLLGPVREGSAIGGFDARILGGRHRDRADHRADASDR